MTQRRDDHIANKVVSKMACASGKRGVIVQGKGVGALQQCNTSSATSIKHKTDTHTTIPLSTQEDAEGFIFSSGLTRMSADHKIVAIMMNSDWFAKCIPTQILRQLRSLRIEKSAIKCSRTVVRIRMRHDPYRECMAGRRPPGLTRPCTFLDGTRRGLGIKQDLCDVVATYDTALLRGRRHLPVHSPGQRLESMSGAQLALGGTYHTLARTVAPLISDLAIFNDGGFVAHLLGLDILRTNHPCGMNQFDEIYALWDELTSVGLCGTPDSEA